MTPTPARYIGDLTPVEIQPEHWYDPGGGGWRTYRRWRGFKPDLLNILLAFASINPVTRFVPLQMDYYEMSVEFAGFVTTGGGVPSPDQQVITLWGCTANLDGRSGWQFPSVAAEMAKITDPEKRARLKGDFEALARGEGITYSADDPKKVAKPLSWSDISSRLKAYGMDSTVMTGLMNAFGRGADSYRAKAPVIRKSMIFPPAANVKVDFSSAGDIWKPGTLLAREPQLEARIRAAVVATPNVFWEVGSVEYEQEATDRCRLQMEYTLVEAWEEFYYGKAL
jgi:hypothetical protein